MTTKRSLIIATILLLAAGSGIVQAQNGSRGNCLNPGRICPRNGSGQCARAGRGSGAAGKGRPVAMKRGPGRGAGMANCPRR
jgi:hypothetical protein